MDMGNLLGGDKAGKLAKQQQEESQRRSLAEKKKKKKVLSQQQADTDQATAKKGRGQSGRGLLTFLSGSGQATLG
ncbi:MAG: hypothetical protein U5K75_08595 [Ahrensia sp.]|nr:hypothetical protein [Ahrensia sp.]